MHWYSPLQLSQIKGCAKATVTRAIARGDLPAKRGKVSEADAANWEPKKRRPKKSDAEPEPTTKQQKPGGPPEEPELTPFQAASQRLKIIEAERAERAWSRERGQLIEREKVEDLLVDVGAVLRSEAQGFPRRKLSEVLRQFGPHDGRRVMVFLERFADEFLRRASAEIEKRLGGIAERKAS